MKVDDRGWIEWEKKDFKKHGTIAKYLVGECRCKKCKHVFCKTIQNKKDSVRGTTRNSF